MRLFALCFSLTLALCFAEPVLHYKLEGTTTLEGWELAKFQVYLTNDDGKEVSEGLLIWKLFYKDTNKTSELLYTQTKYPHYNCFRPKEEGLYSLQVFSGNSEVPIAFEIIQTYPHTGQLKRLATGSACEQELGFVDWINTIREALDYASQEHRLVLIAYFVGCDTSGGLSRTLFKNPEFLKMTEEILCVPIILGGPTDDTGSLYQVATGLSFVLLNSEGVFLGAYFRPELDAFKKMLPDGEKKNKELLKKCRQRKKKIQQLIGTERIYPLAELARFYQEGQSYEQATYYYQQALDLIPANVENPARKIIVENLLFIYITMNNPERIILLAEPLEPKTPYMLFSLGAAYALKAESGKDVLACQQAKAYFDQLKQIPEGAILLESAKKFLEKLEQ